MPMPVSLQLSMFMNHPCRKHDACRIMKSLAFSSQLTMSMK